MDNNTEKIHRKRTLTAGIAGLTQNFRIEIRIVVITVILLCMTADCAWYVNTFCKEEKRKRIMLEERIRQTEAALESAEAANKAKSVFLSNMSHDIRTPMNAIIGFAALLMRDAQNPAKVREYTRKVTASGQHLLSLINDVLDISKIESGKMVLNISEFELADMINAVDTVIRPQTNARNQTFEVLVSGLLHEQLRRKADRFSCG